MHQHSLQDEILYRPYGLKTITPETTDALCIYDVDFTAMAVFQQTPVFWTTRDRGTRMDINIDTNNAVVRIGADLHRKK